MSGPAVQPTDVTVPSGAVRVQAQVPPASPVMLICGARSGDGPEGPVRPGGGGGVVSRTYVLVRVRLVLPAASVCVTASV